jgi:hypothetical protein
MEEMAVDVIQVKEIVTDRIRVVEGVADVI